MIPAAIKLPYNLRGRLPFRLGTTSFILAADYLPNVKALSPWFDEVELLFFESGATFPDAAQIEALAAARAESRIDYNIHLPVDLPVCDEDPAVRRQAAWRMAEVLKRCAPLEASTAALHLPLGTEERTRESRLRWQARVRETLARILDASGLPGSFLSIENLDYPLEWIEETIEALDLSVCLDFGHLVLSGSDPAAAFDRWAPRCRILHLHAAGTGRDDHLSLDCLSPEVATAIETILPRCNETVSLEVFSLNALQRSVAWLAKTLDRCGHQEADARLLGVNKHLQGG